MEPCYQFAMKNLDRGFTLVELMVTLTIIGMLLMVGVPSFISTIQNNRISSQANSFLASLNFARSEAVKRGIRVTICTVNNNDFTKCDSSGSWNQGWIVFVDSSNGFLSSPSTYTPESGSILRVHQSLGGSTLVGNANVNDYISFVSTGMSQQASGAFQAGVLLLCPPSSAVGMMGRSIVINSVGRATISQTSSCQ